MGKPAPWVELEDGFYPMYAPGEMSTEVHARVSECFPSRFTDAMIARILVSRAKYGASEDAYPERVKAVDNIAVRVKLYLEGDAAKGIAPGNVEYLVDAANFCMLEYMHPSLECAFFKSTDSDGSPGLLRRDGVFQHGQHV